MVVQVDFILVCIEVIMCLYWFKVVIQVEKEVCMNLLYIFYKMFYVNNGQLIMFNFYIRVWVQ